MDLSDRNDLSDLSDKMWKLVCAGHWPLTTGYCYSRWGVTDWILARMMWAKRLRWIAAFGLRRTRLWRLAGLLAWVHAGLVFGEDLG